MPAAAVAQVVTVHAGDHHILKLERSNGFGKIHRLVSIQRVRPAVAHIAKRAATRAFVAHDHEGRRALAETFADVGATGFLAHRVQPVFAQDLLDFVKAGAWTAGLDADPVGLFQYLARHHLDRNARQFRGGLLLGQRVVGFAALDVANDC